MTQPNTAANRTVDVVDTDLVPAPWNQLFSNQEWLVHRIVVQSTYAMIVIVLLAHALVWFWRPWLQ